MAMDDREYWKMIDELLQDESDKLNDWEIGFLEDIVRKNEAGILDMTTKRRNKINQIWQKVFG